MKQEKTTEMVLTKKDLVELRMSIHVCTIEKCKKVFYSDDIHQRVCDKCVEEAMIAEGFWNDED